MKEGDPALSKPQGAVDMQIQVDVQELENNKEINSSLPSVSSMSQEDPVEFKLLKGHAIDILSRTNSGKRGYY